MGQEKEKPGRRKIQWWIIYEVTHFCRQYLMFLWQLKILQNVQASKFLLSGPFCPLVHSLFWFSAMHSVWSTHIIAGSIDSSLWTSHTSVQNWCVGRGAMQVMWAQAKVENKSSEVPSLSSTILLHLWYLLKWSKCFQETLPSSLTSVYLVSIFFLHDWHLLVWSAL